jgi:hypothetical protein
MDGWLDGSMAKFMDRFMYEKMDLCMYDLDRIRWIDRNACDGIFGLMAGGRWIDVMEGLMDG